ncbi:MAG: hypothetical protein IJW46_03025 [Clostridia bacterium]|nr:hypothetical protein [Clostridia bacterium]
MATLKNYCEQHSVNPENALEIIVGEGGGILPQKISMQGYFAELTETSLIFTNDVLKVQKEIPFTSFSHAEFGIGSAQLWLQCIVDGNPFVFCLRRKHWKSETAKRMLAKIGEQTEVLGMKEYNGYTGKLFIFYMWK